MKLEEFNSKYSYKADKNYDDWSVITPSSDGMYYGDCESYVLSIQKYIEDLKYVEPYFCKYDGDGHCIGVFGEYYIDCGTQEFRLLKDIPSKYTDIRRIGSIELFIRKTKGKILSLFYKEN